MIIIILHVTFELGLIIILLFLTPYLSQVLRSCKQKRGKYYNLQVHGKPSQKHIYIYTHIHIIIMQAHLITERIVIPFCITEWSDVQPQFQDRHLTSKLPRNL